MANEARIRSSLSIRKLDPANNAIVLLDYPGFGVQSFVADVAGKKGPVPGAIVITTSGIDISLSQLTLPGFCQMANLGRVTGNNYVTDYIEYGVRDSSTNVFYPLGILRPGRSFVLELSPDLGFEKAGTGTGTDASGDFFHMRAIPVSQNAFVGCFEA